ncbi:hypothetical protein BC831DRAFT_547902 [Entophlyctis helioformis]|nr:hypothetical protein BC831DRAFT_547902 [Entophlyctis helioformis]
MNTVESLASLLAGGFAQQGGDANSSRSQGKKNPTGHAQPLFAHPGAIGPQPVQTAAQGAAGKGNATAKTGKTDIWDEDEVDDYVEDQDPRPAPSYDITYRQLVSTEDMYLGMSGKQNSMEHSGQVVVKISLPGVNARDLDMTVANNILDLRCPSFKLKLPLPVRVDDKRGDAKFDASTRVLAVSLPIIRDFPLDLDAHLEALHAALTQASATTESVVASTASLAMGVSSDDPIQSFQLLLLRLKHNRETDADMNWRRSLVLEAAEDVLLLDPAHGILVDADGRLWKYVLYPRIEALRKLFLELQAIKSRVPKEFHKSLAEELDRTQTDLVAQLDFSQAFYRTLLLELHVRFENASVNVAVDEIIAGDSAAGMAVEQSPEQKLVYKIVMLLGDIARYRWMVVRSKSVWNISRLYYEKAFRLWPSGVKPHSQISLLYNYIQDPFHVSYYTLLSVGANTRAAALVRDNLAMQYSRKAIPLGSDQSPTDVQHKLVNLTLAHGDLYQASDATKADSFTNSDALLTDAIASVASSMDDVYAPMISKLSVMYMIIASDLDIRFQYTDQAAVKQKIRTAQTYAIAGVLSLACHSLDTLLKRSEDNSSFFDDIGSQDSVPSIHAAHLAIVAAFLRLNIDQLFVMQDYARQFKLAPIVDRIEVFASLLAQFANKISSFADMEGSVEAVPEDVDLLGLACMRKFYASLDRDSLDRVLTLRRSSDASDGDLASVRVSRIGSLAVLLASHGKFDALGRNEEDGVFMRSREFKARKQLRLMKAMGRERLKGDVDLLQQELAQVQNKPHPLVVLDALAHVTGLNAVKTSLMRRSCIIAIPLEVLHQFDTLKLGQDRISADARRCIRYLEERFKYPSPHLIAQGASSLPSSTPPINKTASASLPAKPATSAIPSVMANAFSGPSIRSKSMGSPGSIASAAPSTASPNSFASATDTQQPLFIPKTHNDLMRYCLAMQSHVGKFMPGVAAIKSFAFVSDDPESVGIAKSLGITCMSVAVWERSIVRSRQPK